MAAQISLVADRAADVGRRTAAFGADQAWIAHAGLGRAARKNADRVLPVLAEHIVVRKGVAARQNVREGRLVGRRQNFLGIAIRLAPGLVADAKLERMAVLPADGDLQHEMQIVEPNVDRNLDDTHDPRHDVIDLDGKTRDLARRRR